MSKLPDTDHKPHGHLDRDGLKLGVHDDISETEYHDDPSLSSTLIREASTSIDHYLHALEDDSDSEAMRLGRLVHCAVLEWGRFAKQYLDAPEPPVDVGDMYWRHQETAELMAEGHDAPSISDEIGVKADTVRGYMDDEQEVQKLYEFLREYPDYDPDSRPDEETLDEVQRIAESVRQHPKIRGGLLSGGHAERTHVWQWGDWPVRCRARPDYDQPGPVGGGRLLVDLKTTGRSLGYWKRRAVWQRRYHQQAAWYRQAVERTTGETVTGFLFVAVQTKPPYPVEIYQLGADALDRGHEQNAEAVQQIVEYWRDPDRFTGTQQQIETLNCPQWI